MIICALINIYIFCVFSVLKRNPATQNAAPLYVSGSISGRYLLLMIQEGIATYQYCLAPVTDSGCPGGSFL